ncbi:PhzF family phenazine biosynthesis protein [Streptomyces sp. NPDC003374]
MTDASPAQVLRYTAFSADPGGGNPAGVVLDATGLADHEMQAIAAEVGYSETAFLFPGPPPGPTPHKAGRRKDQRTFRVRYFSPEAEVTFCGHATIASAVALAERTGPGDLVFHTPAGTVPVTVTVDGASRPRATLTSVEPRVEDAAPEVVAEACAALGWKPSELDAALPPRIAYAGARHLVLAAATRERLADLSYDFSRLAGLMRQEDLTTLQLVWRESATTFHVRDPFPVGGVVEDPATGAAAAAFGAYARETGLVPGAAVLTLHQGADMGRPSTLTVELRAGDPRVRVSGTGARI